MFRIQIVTSYYNSCNKWMGSDAEYDDGKGRTEKRRITDVSISVGEANGCKCQGL